MTAASRHQQELAPRHCHRLKAAGGNKTMDALLALQCPRRVIVSGTPIQNNLGEFFCTTRSASCTALSLCCQPQRCCGLWRPACSQRTSPPFSGFLPPPSRRRRSVAPQTSSANWVPPVQSASFDAGAENSNNNTCVVRRELKRRVDGFVLRRTAEVNQRFLPPLTTVVVWCRPTAIQQTLYKRVLRSKQVGALLSGSERGMDATLAALMQLRKLCNHPQLVGDMLEEGEAVDEDTDSGKCVVLAMLLHAVLSRGERMVVVSTSTAALDLVHSLCTRRGWSTVRIDGATEAGKRMDVVHAFNTCNVGQVRVEDDAVEACVMVGCVHPGLFALDARGWDWSQPHWCKPFGAARFGLEPLCW